MSKKEVRRLGRLPKEGFEYFPLDCDFFENDKIKALRRAHGAVGVSTYLNILCRIYSSHGYYYEFRDFDVLVEDIADQIAGKTDRRKHVSACVRESIRYLIDHEILDRGLIEQTVMTGHAMQEKYIEMVLRSRRKLKMDVHVLVDVRLVISKFRISAEEMPISAEEIPIYAEKMQQSKSKSKNKRETSFLSSACACERAGARTSEQVESSPSNFNTDQFFEAAVRRSYGDKYEELYSKGEEKKNGAE